MRFDPRLFIIFMSCQASLVRAATTVDEIDEGV